MALKDVKPTMAERNAIRKQLQEAEKKLAEAKKYMMDNTVENQERRYAEKMNELDMERSILTQRLHDLKEDKTTEIIYAKNGGDIGTDTLHSTVGSSSEIEQTESQIENLNKQYSETKERSKDSLSMAQVSIRAEENYDSAKKQYEEAKKEASEDLNEKVKSSRRNMDFHDLQRVYNARTNAFSRFINKITGKAPKWGEISNLSEQEMRYLLHAAKGKTVKQEAKAQKINKQKNLSFREKQEKIKKSNWKYFMDRAANVNKTEIKKEVEAESRHM